MCRLLTSTSLPEETVNTILVSSPSEATTSPTPAPDNALLISNTASSTVDVAGVLLIEAVNATFTVVPL